MRIEERSSILQDCACPGYVRLAADARQNLEGLAMFGLLKLIVERALRKQSYASFLCTIGIYHCKLQRGAPQEQWRKHHTMCRRSYVRFPPKVCLQVAKYPETCKPAHPWNLSLVRALASLDRFLCKGFDKGVCVARLFIRDVLRKSNSGHFRVQG